MAEAQAPKAERSQIISSLLEDFKTWIPKIPVIGKAQKGRMSQEAGYAIMGRIALFNQRWDEAITAYKNVVGKVQLFKSGDGTDYAANYADSVSYTHLDGMYSRIPSSSNVSNWNFLTRMKNKNHS